jgi:nitrile hydratase
MNGVHDMGGMHGFGAVPEDDARFHADWERTAYAMNKLLRMQGVYNIHEYRHSVERLDPATYLGASYFERWFRAVEQLAEEADVLTETEVEERLAAIQAGEYDPATAEEGTQRVATADAPPAFEPRTHPEDLPAAAREAFERGADPDTEAVDARFDPGERVRVRNVHPAGHTRVPRYARGEVATVTAVHGVQALPDARAHGEDRSEPVYGVRFSAERLWGEDTDGDELSLDMWESYLEPA